MAKVYNFPLGIKNPQLAEQPFSLYQLMHGVPEHKDERTREGDCYVTGIRFVQNGTQEFNELIETQRKRFEWMEIGPEKIERILTEIRSKDNLTLTTNFAAMAHPLYWDETAQLFRGLDGCPYRAFATDFGSLAIIHPEEGRIVIVPYDKEGRHRNLFYDIKGSKMAGVRWQYDGTIGDALTEFADTYRFDMGRAPRNSKEALEIRNSYPREHSRDYIVTDENISLEKVIEIIFR